MTDPAWLEDVATGMPESDGWTLVCEFDVPPSQQGNPSVARVQFAMDDAPHDRLHSGARLRLFETATQDFAIIEITE
jgi:hypothetical protein